MGETKVVGKLISINTTKEQSWIPKYRLDMAEYADFKSDMYNSSVQFLEFEDDRGQVIWYGKAQIVTILVEDVLHADE